MLKHRYKYACGSVCATAAVYGNSDYLFVPDMVKSSNRAQYKRPSETFQTAFRNFRKPRFLRRLKPICVSRRPCFVEAAGSVFQAEFRCARVGGKHFAVR